MRLSTRKTVMLSMLLAAIAAPEANAAKAVAPGEPFDGCEGSFDTSPVVVAYVPLTVPTAVLSPRRWEDLTVRRHPLVWIGDTRFEIDAQGVPRNVTSDATYPKEFAQAINTTAASWRFKPAMLDGVPVPATCVVQYWFDLRTRYQAAKEPAEEAAKRAPKP